MADYVLDASAALSWVLPRQGTAAADALLARRPGPVFLAPRQFVLEVRSGLLKAERRGRSKEADTTAGLAFLASVDIELDDAFSDARADAAIRLARALTLSIYDALYLDLALRRRLPLASRDERLLAAGRAVGLEVYDALGDGR